MALVTFIRNGASDDLNVYRNNQLVAGLCLTQENTWQFVGRGNPKMAGSAPCVAGNLAVFDQSAELPKIYQPLGTFPALQEAVLAAYRCERDCPEDAERLSFETARSLRKGARTYLNKVWP